MHVFSLLKYTNVLKGKNYVHVGYVIIYYLNVINYNIIIRQLRVLRCLMGHLAANVYL